MSNDPSISEYKVEHNLKHKLSRYFRRSRIRWEHSRHAIKVSGVEIFSDSRSCYHQELSENINEADLIVLYWVAGYLDMEAFFKKYGHKRIVWRLSDMNPFTGGCHYPMGCERFKTGCGLCPQLRSDQQNDLTKSIFDHKKGIYSSIQKQNLQFVTPSKWMSNQVEESPLINEFRHTLIPTGVDTHDFRPLNKVVLKECLGVPADKRIIVTAAASLENPRKGFQYLIEALSLVRNPEAYFLITIGNSKSPPIDKIGTLNLRRISSDELLNVAYNSGDVFVLTSTEENLPNTGIEAMSSGIPLIGFPVGGISDLIDHGENGLFTDAINAQSLAESIELIFERYELDVLGENARRKAVSEFSMDKQIEGYLELFGTLMGQH